ncbi:DUF3263 domain-containing protein [Curtobacterium sp. SORGH_AS_0776]|uniref:DUF3263 domain-containing protein n=1 Tax=Curtobacterium sp. SORGH_AS_0776 TaxID=3041798 RepID=UPI0037C09BCE
MNGADRLLLDFESTHPRNDRSKEAAIRDTFGYSWVRYQQRLMQLTRDRDAVAACPMVCARVVRISRRNGLRQMPEIRSTAPRT